MKPALVIGGSSFGKLVARLVEETGYAFTGYIDDFNEGPQILGNREDLGSRYLPNDYDLVLAIGYNDLAARRRVYQEAVGRGFHFPALVHPRAIVSPHAVIGDGCLIMAGAHVDAFARLGDGCVLWPGAVVSHDSQIGANTFLSPNATICGFVTVGHSSFIGAGSVVVDRTELPDGAFVKAGNRQGGRQS